MFGTADGSFAELACAKVERLARKPQAITFEQAASIPIAGCTALQALRDHGRLESAQHVLVIGAAGGVGSFAVQIAKALGADVTGVCSTAHLDFVRALGADTLVDYTREEPSGRYDLVMQVAGDASVAQLRQLLTAQGTLVIVGGGTGRDGKPGVLGPLTRMLVARAVPRKNGRRVATFIAKIRTPGPQGARRARRGRPNTTCGRAHVSTRAGGRRTHGDRIRPHQRQARRHHPRLATCYARPAATWATRAAPSSTEMPSVFTTRS